MKKEDQKVVSEVIDRAIRNYRDRITEWKESDFNRIVVTHIQAGGNGVETRIGRAVQVRLEDGDFGSDTVFLRHSIGDDHILWTHANQSYYPVLDEDIEKVAHLFPEEPEGRTYTSAANNNEDGMTGFIIASQVPEGGTTPMREVREQIKRALFGRQ